MKGVALIVAVVVVMAFLLWLSLLGVRICWDYVTDHMLTGMQSAGLIADEIGWWDAFVLLVMGNLLASGSLFAIRSRK